MGFLSFLFGKNKTAKEPTNVIKDVPITNYEPIRVNVQNNSSELIKAYDLSYTNQNSPVNDYVVLDFETTGFSPAQDSIIQIAAIKYKDHKEIDRFVSFVNPQRPIPQKITKITGISYQDVVNAPTIDMIFPEFLSFIGSFVLMAHNASFDMKFLLHNSQKLSLGKPENRVIDTLKVARKHITDTENHKLETLKKWLGLNLASHNALDDWIVCASVYQKCVNIDDKNVTKNKDPKLSTKIELTDDERIVFEIIKDLLKKNNRDLSLVSYHHVGNYFDVIAFYSFTRIKLKGKKRYILTRKTIEEVLKSFPEANCEPATKSETGTTRIIIEGPLDIRDFELLFIDDFDSAVQSMNYYKDNVAKGSETVNDYLSRV